MPLLLLAIYAGLALVIYTGAVVLPDRVKTSRDRAEEKNFFLNQEPNIVSGPGEQAIARKYKTVLDEMEGQMRQDLTGLSISAYREYKELKAEDPDISPYSLAGKYLGKLRALEKEYDSRFNQYMQNMERDLKAASLSTELADHARYAYRARKRALKKEFLEKARQKLGRD